MSGRGSVFGGHERGASGYSNLEGAGGGGARRSGFGEFGVGRPGSAYSVGAGSLAGSAVGRPSPLGGGEMRQVGQGERASRVSFAAGEAGAGRPSFSSSRKGPASIYSRHRESSHGGGGPASPSLPPPPLPSASPTKRASQGYFGAFAPHARGSTVNSVHSVGSVGGGGGGMGTPPLAAGGMGRSHTTEELSSVALSLGGLPRMRASGHARTKSSLQQVYRASIAEEIAPALAYLDQPEEAATPSAQGERPKSPFDDPEPRALATAIPPVAVLAPEPEGELERALSPVSDMPIAFAGGTDPDDAFAAYTRGQAAHPSPALSAAPAMSRAPSSASMIKSRSAGLLAGLSAGPGKMMRSLSARGSALRAGAVSPAVPVDPRPTSPIAGARPTSPPLPMFATVLSPPADAGAEGNVGMASLPSTPIADALARGQVMARAESSPLANEVGRAVGGVEGGVAGLGPVRPPLSPGASFVGNPFKDGSASEGGGKRAGSSDDGSLGQAM